MMDMTDTPMYVALVTDSGNYHFTTTAVRDTTDDGSMPALCDVVGASPRNGNPRAPGLPADLTLQVAETAKSTDIAFCTDCIALVGAAADPAAAAVLEDYLYLQASYVPSDWTPRSAADIATWANSVDITATAADVVAAEDRMIARGTLLARISDGVA